MTVVATPTLPDEVVMREEPDTCTCGGKLKRLDHEAIHRKFVCTSCNKTHRVQMDFSTQASPRPYSNPNALCTCGPYYCGDGGFCPRHG